MSEVQTIKTMIHEMAHQKLLLRSGSASEELETTRNARGRSERPCLHCFQHYGIETSDYSFAYIAGWSRARHSGT